MRATGIDATPAPQAGYDDNEQNGNGEHRGGSRSGGHPHFR